MNPGKRMTVVTFHIPEPWLQAIDQIIRRGAFPNRAEFIRAAVREYIWEWMKHEAD